ncbi:ABC transporter substrate-binding protein [Rhodococcus sp. NPDC057529]|uniref:ABC transporter substrate-binding protein n=1 Tax=Rhodococcus sp. NPDC057529 TaxID=3346158 RepID=UPI00367296B2
MTRKSHTMAAVVAVGAAATLLLSGCAGEAGGNGRDIAFIQGLSGDEFYITMQCGIESAAKDAGATVNTQGPTKFDPTLQKPLVDSVVASRPAAILIAPTDAAAMRAPLRAAERAGIKVILVDTTLDDPSIGESRIASDNKGGGAEAFAAIRQLNPNGGKVLVMSTDPGVSTLDARVAGFQGAVEQDPKFSYLGVQYSHNDPAEAAKIMSAALSKDPDIVGVFAANLIAAEGTATGVRQASKQDQVKIVGFDAGPAQVDQLREGTVQALIAQEPATIGTDGVEQALAAIDGKPVTANIQTGFQVITAENVDTEGAKWIYKSSC